MIYYFLHSRDSSFGAPVFIVKVGRQTCELEAHAELAARALWSNDFYYCVKSLESQQFFGRLMQENPQREIYEVSPSRLLAILENRASADYAENLSERFRTNWARMFHLINRRPWTTAL